MMPRLIALALVLLGSPIYAQDIVVFDSPNRAQARIAQLEQENADLRAQLRAQPAKEPTPAAEYHITLVKAPPEMRCVPCDESEKYDPPYYKKNGWAWETTVDKVAVPGRTYPYYIVCTPARCDQFHAPRAPSNGTQPGFELFKRIQQAAAVAKMTKRGMRPMLGVWPP
jgi:hypothetical protein